jgi:hypothetical protein
MNARNQLRVITHGTKRLALMGVALVAGATCLFVQSAHATLLFQEGFNYTAASNLSGNGGWTGGSATNLQIGTSDLTYPGLLDLGGNSLVVLNAKSTLDSNVFSGGPVTSGNLYYSFVINGTTAATNNSYMTGLDPVGGSLTGSSDALAIYYGTSTAGNYRIGVRTTSGGSGAAYASTALALGTTYFIVAEYTFNANHQDSISLFLDPTPGGTQPATPDAVQTQLTASVIGNIGDVAFKAQGVAYGQWTVNDLNIGTTWADVTPAATVVPEPSTLALFGLGVLGLVFARRMRR